VIDDMTVAAALAELREAVARYHAAITEATQSLAHRDEKIRAALRARVSQAQICEITGLTSREQVRRIGKGTNLPLTLP
jgi:hypothetical protein